MKCLRCGYCCTKLAVVIVIDPENFDPDNIQYENLKAFDQNKERCPHLRGDKAGEYSCAIHHYSWFKDTPCGMHSQIERRDSNCRTGEYLLKKEKEFDTLESNLKFLNSYLGSK